MSAARAGGFSAIVLVGGTGSRLGGVDKGSLEVGGHTLLERALAATSDADEVVVVGDRVATSRPVRWTREQPPGGGPAAGLLAGLDALTEPAGLVCALAVDMPHVSVSTVARLVVAVDTAEGPVDGAVLVGGDGHRQTLAAVYRTSALTSVRPVRRGDERGLSMRRLVARLRLAEVPAHGLEGRDVDTWEDLRDLS